MSAIDQHPAAVNPFLLDGMFPQAKRQVKPRTPYRLRSIQHLRAPKLSKTSNIEDLSALLADIEHDQKGVPVLIRQYLKLGGRMLGFNIDAQFNDVVDCLIRVDLRETDPKNSV